MLRHERFRSREEIIDEYHGMIIERLGGKHLSKGDKIRMLELFPLVDQNHAFGVDQSEPVNSTQGHALAVLRVGGLVDRGDVAEGLRFVHRGRGWGFEGAELGEVVHGTWKLAAGFGVDLKKRCLTGWSRKIETNLAVFT